jgi:dihydrolipoamide dehydrogenase
MNKVTVYAPDFGVENSKVAEIIVKKGNKIRAEDSIIVLESDKAITEVPSDYAGKVLNILVKVGDIISSGTALLELETEESVSDAKEQATSEPQPEKQQEKKQEKQKETASPQTKDKPATKQNTDYDYDVCVIGGGPGGYTAAFRAADLGLKVCLVERYEVLGGVCLNVGCIPSKALLHIAEVINNAKHSTDYGVAFSAPKIDLNKIKEHKQSITSELNAGLAKIAKLRNVEVVYGPASLKDEHKATIKQGKKNIEVSFASAIIAVGSSVTKLPFVPEHENVWDSTDALALKKIPKTMLILGGGIIGLEMATVYNALGTKITVVELGGQIIPEADKDSILPLLKQIKRDYEDIWLNTKATKIVPTKTAVEVHFEGAKAPEKQKFDVVLVAVGRSPNGKTINAEKVGVEVTEQGFIEVDLQQKTNVPHIYAIGDVVGQPMLAHKATHQAKVAAEVIAGEASSFSPLSIPSVAYTHPEIAWVGKTEKQLKEENIEYDKGMFPWQASGRALSSGGKEGISKALFCKNTKRLLGASISGINAGELISEAVLAMEMGADASDISLTIHPHPTLAETFAMASEIVDGSITDILPPKPRS